VTNRQEIELLIGALKDALRWCVNDRDNEDDYPTQEMLENRVEAIEETLRRVGEGKSKEPH
jgi:ABC-type nitrate/sulfonate/bicarbonate transport system substrate-binding protein